MTRLFNLKIKTISIVIIIFLMAISVFSKPKQILRISSLSPNITEIIYQLGGEKYLVGRSQSCNYPSEAKKIAVVGNFASIYIEKILTTNTNLILSIPLPNLKHRQMLKKLKVKFVELEFDSIRNYCDNVMKIGKILNLQQPAIKEVKRISKLLKKQQRIINKVSIKKRPKVLFVIWNKPLIVVGKKSFLNEFIQLSGGVNVAKNINQSYGKVSKEWLLAQKIDCILVTKEAATLFKASFSESEKNIISAFKNNRIYTLQKEDEVLRLSPRMFDGIKELNGFIQNENKKN